MWQPLISETVNSNQKLREYARQQGEQSAKLYPELAKSTLKKEIEALLEEKEAGWLSKIKELLKKAEMAAFKNMDEELRMVDWLCLCSEKERKAGRLSLLYRCDSLQQVKEISQIAVFYLTRIELDMEKEFYMDFVQFIREWSLSPEYIAMIMEKGDFSDRAYTGRRLAEVLQEQGETLYAEEILKGLGKQGKTV